MSAIRLILPKGLRASALLLLCFVAPFSAVSAGAQDEPAISPEACVGIGADAERLACYDRVFGRDRRPGSAAESTPTPELTTRPVPESVGPEEQAVASSLLDSRWELSHKAKLGTFGLRAYKPLYVLPGVFTEEPNQFPSSPEPGHAVEISESQDNFEAKFQISLKTKVAQELFGRHGDLWFGYTQSSRWQVYSSAQSRPFRESNYEPELMLVFGTRFRLLGFDGRLLGISLNHQSNGKDLPYSRSWNRVIGMAGFEREAWTVLVRPWWRVPERAGEEDNSDIEDYAGRGDILVVRRLHDHELSLLARHSLRDGARSHGALELGWVFPIRNQLKGYLQLFHGYGESLIDYNASLTRIGLGISLLEWY